MAKYNHRWASVEANPFVPAKAPDEGQPANPEMEGVEKVVVMDGAGAPRATVFMVGEGPHRMGVRDGDMVAKNLATGQYRAFSPQDFAAEFFPSEDVEPPDEAPAIPASKPMAAKAAAPKPLLDMGKPAVED